MAGEGYLARWLGAGEGEGVCHYTIDSSFHPFEIAIAAVNDFILVGCIAMSHKDAVLAVESEKNSGEHI